MKKCLQPRKNAPRVPVPGAKGISRQLWRAPPVHRAPGQFRVGRQLTQDSVQPQMRFLSLIDKQSPWSNSSGGIRSPGRMTSLSDQ